MLRWKKQIGERVGAFTAYNLNLLIQQMAPELESNIYEYMFSVFKIQFKF